MTSYTSENHERAKGIFRAIYESGYTRLGPMLGGAESLSFAATGGGNLWDSNTFAYMLLGDPEMEIRRRSVQFTAVVVVSGIDPEMVARLDLILDGYRFTAEYLQAPALEAVGFVDGGGFKVRLKDAPEGTFRIYGSSDMNTWEPLGLATQVGSDQEFVDPMAPKGGGAKRFYRAVEEP